MRIIFMGTPEFACVSLKTLIEHKNIDVAAVVTVPDKAQGRGLKTQASPVKSMALENELPVLQPESLNDPDFIAELKEFKADAFVVVAFKILPQEVFTIPAKGTINLHASLLPRYRGAAPINWAIINGDHITGVTTMLIDKKVDTGQILLQRKTPIQSQMTAGELHDHLARIGADLLPQTLEALQVGTLKATPQNDALATKAPKIEKEMCHIDFNKPVQEVFNWVRGLSPHPGAFFYHGEHQIKVFKATVGDDNGNDYEAGKVIHKNHESFTVGCKPGLLKITEVQMQGKKRLPVYDFFHGYTIEVNETLT
ncbi:MAG: methionyl-tRNA formyltransferase [Caldithrix sp.]|nr:methionyl-tRNA formyltransferase [Caldithrix sp.]